MTTQGEIEVLLVEDNASDVELTLRALQKRNLANRVVVARDGVEALQILEGPAPLPKVVLLDLKLPKLNGLEVLRRMKSDERTKRIPVVVLTSSHEEPDVEESYRLGVNSYVVKPVDFESFATAVAEVGLYWLLLNHPPE
ncbi:MAG: two-component system response regulator [Gemmatimonadetes bacterium]|nr:MAG: two-component system response regulator [Gemmatimonadota bacterium]